MKKTSFMKPLVGVLCVLALVLVAAVALILDSRSPDPILGIFQTEPTTSAPEESTADDATESTETNATEPSDGVFVPPDLPPSVELPVEKDPQTGESAGIKFPCTVPGYALVIEKLAPYNGMYVEDGSNGNVQEVAMLLVHNNGDFPVEYTQITIQYENASLEFDISALPVGETLVVQEKNGKAVPEGNALSASAMVVQRADMQMSADKISVTDNGDNTLTVRNLTDEVIPTVRVFYKYYMKDENIFVGGIAFTVRIIRLAAGESITVQPSHYTSQTSRVVMALTYDSEV